VFENFSPGKTGALDDRTRLECGVCWWVYDPAEGDPVWQVVPGTPFAALPEHGRCPRCDAPPDKFMVLRDDR
jgi:rubredoxin